MRNIARRYARGYVLVLAFGLTPALVACQTKGGAASKAAGDNGEELVINDPGAGQLSDPTDAESPPASAKAAAAEAEAPLAEPAPENGPKYNLGPLTDEELQDAAYAGLRETIGARKNLGDGAEETTELGDQSAFKFNIVKLLRGKDDISGEGGAADGMDVEVTGWYKRSIGNKAEHQEPACTSFDALVAISKQGDVWHLTPGENPTFGREDSEDCF